MTAAKVERIDPRRLAEVGAQRSGQVALSCMPRLRAMTVAGQVGADASEPQAAYTLTFAEQDNGRLGVTGRVSATVALPCQRCLEAVNVELDARVALELVDGDAADPMDPDREPLYVEGPVVLATLLEDELLLGVPFAPAHAEGECGVNEQYVAQAAAAGQRVSPFAALAALKDRGEGHND